MSFIPLKDILNKTRQRSDTVSSVKEINFWNLFNEAVRELCHGKEPLEIKPLYFRNGVFNLIVFSEKASKELSLKEKVIIDRINMRLGKVIGRGIRQLGTH